MIPIQLDIMISSLRMNFDGRKKKAPMSGVQAVMMIKRDPGGPSGTSVNMSKQVCTCCQTVVGRVVQPDTAVVSSGGCGPSGNGGDTERSPNRKEER